MKKTFAIAALILVAVTSVFAAPVKAVKANNTVSFIEPAKENTFAVKVAAEIAVVIIYDQDGNAIYKDLNSKGQPTKKSYNVSNLDNGNYTVEIKSEKSDIKKQMHVYDNGQGKSYLFIQKFHKQYVLYMQIRSIALVGGDAFLFYRNLDKQAVHSTHPVFAAHDHPLYGKP